MGCFVYIILGSCKDVPMGPSSIASLLTFQATGGIWQKAVLLCFLTGLVEIVMGVIGMGFFLNFISGPVNSGFTSAAALIILTSQVKNVLGIKANGSTFIETWSSIFRNISEIRWIDTCMGVACLIVLLLMRLLTEIRLKDEIVVKSKWHKLLNKSIWLIGTSRNAILVILTGFISYVLHHSVQGNLQVIGTIPSGMPTFQMPPFSLPNIVNETTHEIAHKGESFTEMVSQMGYTIIVIPLIALLENMSICKAFGKCSTTHYRVDVIGQQGEFQADLQLIDMFFFHYVAAAEGKSVDATQELLAIGTSNIVNSFVQGYPGTGALSRGAVNHASGVRTPMGGLFTGLLVIASLYMTPIFYYIPKAALASIIIAAVIFMVEVRVVKPMWRSKSEFCFEFYLLFVWI